MKVKLLCYIKIESYLALCEGVCQTALKTTYCKLEFTKLTKCLRGSYDEPLKERALSDNSGNFEQKCCKCVSFLCIFEGERGLASRFCSRAFCCCCGEMHSLYDYEVIYYFIVALRLGLTWGYSSLCWGFCSLKPCWSASHPTPSPQHRGMSLSVFPALHLRPVADALSCLCLSPCPVSLQAAWTLGSVSPFFAGQRCLMVVSVRAHTAPPHS